MAVRVAVAVVGAVAIAVVAVGCCGHSGVSWWAWPPLSLPWLVWPLCVCRSGRGCRHVGWRAGFVGALCQTCLPGMLSEWCVAGVVCCKVLIPASSLIR